MVVRACILTPLGVTGQTYSQVPQPVQSCWLILTPTPGISFIAPDTQRSIQAIQPQFLARQVSLWATADKSSWEAGTKSDMSGNVMAGSDELFKMPLAEHIASPSENRLFLKKSFRLMFMFSLFPYSEAWHP
jgi:hypothetical protein